MALKSSFRGTEVASCSSRVRPFVAARPCQSGRRAAAVVRAAAEGSSVPPTLSWPQDTETARDIFAFAGSLPERLNGRMAMIGFAGIALAELQQQVPAAEQFANDVSGVALLSITLTLASIFPKFVSGCSLQDLHASATSDNLRAQQGVGQALALFDTNTELWTGRVAMIGIVGLLAVEAFTGKVLL
ncbi:early light-inducible protein [Scenedesmus sp. NREL 46B-D3]|nr:early light-inducible protein [Scenedesmus sp. NREL 46B-D3]